MEQLQVSGYNKAGGLVELNKCTESSSFEVTPADQIFYTVDVHTRDGVFIPRQSRAFGSLELAMVHFLALTTVN